MGRIRPESHSLQPAAACLSRTASSPSPSSETNFSAAPWPSQPPPPLITPRPIDPTAAMFFNPSTTTPAVEPSKRTFSSHYHNLELQLSTTTSVSCSSKRADGGRATHLQLSIGSCDISDNRIISPRESNSNCGGEKPELMVAALSEKAYAEAARRETKRQIEMAEKEFAHAKRIRQQAAAEVERAQALKEHAIRQINSTMMQITCHACKKQFQARNPREEDGGSLIFSYVSSSAVTEEGDQVGGT